MPQQVAQYISYLPTYQPKTIGGRDALTYQCAPPGKTYATQGREADQKAGLALTLP